MVACGRLLARRGPTPASPASAGACCSASGAGPPPPLRPPQPAGPGPTPRREILLQSSTALVLGALLSVGRAPRPSSLGLQRWGGAAQLGLCPRTNNCISTAEEANDQG